MSLYKNSDNHRTVVVKKTNQVIDVCLTNHAGDRTTESKRCVSWKEITDLVSKSSLNARVLGHNAKVFIKSPDETLVLLGEIIAHEFEFKGKKRVEWNLVLITVIKVELEKGVFKSIKIDESTVDAVIKVEDER